MTHSFAHSSILQSAQDEGAGQAWGQEDTQDVILQHINTKEGLKEILMQVLQNRIAQSLESRHTSGGFLEKLNTVLNANGDHQGGQLLIIN